MIEAENHTEIKHVEKAKKIDILKSSYTYCDYPEIYKDEKITYGIIEIHFQYSVTVNVEKFLQTVQNQVAQLGLMIRYCVSEEK